MFIKRFPARWADQSTRKADSMDNMSTCGESARVISGNVSNARNIGRLLCLLKHIDQ